MVIKWGIGYVGQNMGVSKKPVNIGNRHLIVWIEQKKYHINTCRNIHTVPDSPWNFLIPADKLQNIVIKQNQHNIRRDKVQTHRKGS